MSNALAISAVTATLRQILNDAGIANVTTLPMDKAASEQQPDRVNLMLYQVVPNAAWRNQPMPGRVRAGEQGFPPLALNLQYLLTVFGDGSASLSDHSLLGRAMLAFHDRTVLHSKDILSATSSIRDTFLNANPDLHQQVEQVKLNFQVMNMEELSKLWSTFQTQYRLSVPFEASVVLIESQRATKTPLPVTQRGKSDRGWDTQPNLGPVIDRIDYLDPTVLGARPFPAATFPKFGQPNFVCSIVGTDLPTSGVKILIHDPGPPSGEELVATIDPLPLSTKERIRFEVNPQLTDSKWKSGELSLSLRYPGLNDRHKTTAPIRFQLAPRLRIGPNNRVIAIPSIKQSKSLLTFHCDPPPASDRFRILLDRLTDNDNEVDSRQLEAFKDTHDPDTERTTSPSLTFDATDVPPGDYRVRLRVDLVDSHVFQRNTENPAIIEFDDSQQISIG